MKNMFSLRRSTSLFLTIIAIFLFGALHAQTEEKDLSHEDLRLNADALALAYSTCKYEMAQYNLQKNEGNSVLQAEFRKIAKTHQKFFVNINAKYEQDPSSFDKFKNKVKSSRRKLPTCITYDNIMDTKANIEKSGAGNSQ